jgi:hypothetical protein
MNVREDRATAAALHSWYPEIHDNVQTSSNSDCDFKMTSVQSGHANASYKRALRDTLTSCDIWETSDLSFAKIRN